MGHGKAKKVTKDRVEKIFYKKQNKMLNNFHCSLPHVSHITYTVLAET